MRNARRNRLCHPIAPAGSRGSKTYRCAGSFSLHFDVDVGDPSGSTATVSPPRRGVNADLMLGGRTRCHAQRGRRRHAHALILQFSSTEYHLLYLCVKSDRDHERLPTPRHTPRYDPYSFSVGRPPLAARAGERGWASWELRAKSQGYYFRFKDFF